MRTDARIAIAVSMILLAGCDRVVGVTDRFRDHFGSEAGPAPEGEPATLAATAPEVSGPAAWDGVPSLGGVWVAHPDVVEPVRVRIARAGGGPSARGWLFARDAGGEGPALQVSSEAAEALGMDAGETTELSVEPLDAAPAAPPG